jgi:very-short-patch-repair endonuclease
VIALADVSYRPLEQWLTPSGAVEAERAAVRVVADLLREFFARRDKVREAQRCAISNAGPAWDRLPADLSADPSDGEVSLGELTPVGLAITPLTKHQIGELDHWFTSLSDILESADRRGATIAVQLGCPEPATMEQAEDLVALLELSTAIDRPLDGWFDPQVLPLVRQACDEIVTAAAQLDSARQRAQDWFRPEIVEKQGIAEAIARLTEGPRGLGGLMSRTIRADRKLIASMTVAGAWHSQLYELLPLAGAWCTAYQRLRGLARGYVDLLGRYAGTDLPEVERLQAACSCAEQVHRLAATTLEDLQRRRLLSAHLADGREPDHELIGRGVELGRDLARWRVDANRLPLSAYATELSKKRPGEIARWLSAHLDPLQRAAALVDAVTATCGEGGETAASYTLATARRAIAHAHSAQQETADFLSREREDRQLLSSWYKGLDTNPSALAAPASGGYTKIDPVEDLLRRSIGEMSTGQGRTATTEDYKLLGRYCTSRQIDSDLLCCALEAVKTVDRVASASLVDPTRRARLCEAISDSRPNRPDLVRRAGRIADGLDSWEAWTRQPEIADRAAALQAASFEASIHWLRAHVDPADDAADFIRSVSRVDDNGGEMALLRARAAVAEVSKARAAADEFESGDERWSMLLGEMYCGVETDHSAVLDAVNWAQRVRRAAGGVQLRHSEHGSRSRRTINASRPLPLSSAAARTMLTAPVDSSFDQIRAEWRGLRKELAGLFETERSGEIGTALSRSLSSARAVVSRLSADQRGPEVWSRYRAALAEFIEHGLGALPSQLARQGIAAADVAATVERAILTAWVEDLLATDLRLASIRAEDRNRLVEQFRAADRELIRGAPAAVINSCDARRPRRTNVGSAAVITSEAEKQRRHMPVRRLLRETRDVVQRIKPCFMMSPLTVSQFLPPDFHFDVVIFDEASQVRPEDAVNSIYRADALIVAGDQKQLPPTSFFGASGDTEDDEWDEDDSDAFQSVLDACKASGVLRSLPLRWHYRSRHENLIAFSNHEFYRNTMVTFPGASQDGPDIGVEFFKSSGVYDRSGRRDNSGEAALVAERVIHHYATRPSLTLGVVALSKSQADAIEAAVEKARAARPDLGEFITDDRLDGFFVKNLENVQGDERDVIILSIGYGRDQQGKLRSEFGPINRGEGWRRLNVAVTRARRRVELVASFRGGELPDSTNKSVQHLKRYLLYAESGPRILATAAADADAAPESPFEEQVIDVLRDWGYDVQPQVGVAGYRIDMAIKHPEAQGIYALGIECDGAMYHSSRAARDRDRLRESVLRDLGWRLHRIWGTDWYRNRADAMERLRSEVAAACAMDPYSMGRPEPKNVRPEPSRTRSDEVEEPSMSTAVRVAPVEHELTAWTRPYQHVGIDELIELRRTSADRRGLDLVALQDPEAFEMVADIVLRVVEVEGPVEEDLLFTRVRTAWGVGRSGSVIQVRIREVLHWLDREKAVVRLGTAYDLPARELRFVRTATSIGGRLVRQIPAIERQLAIRNVIADCLSVRREELLSEVAGVFGWTRVRSDIRATLTADLDSLIEQGIVEETALGMTLAGGV